MFKYVKVFKFVAYVVPGIKNYMYTNIMPCTEMSYPFTIETAH